MKIHFIAIGGAIMHQLALALHRKGYQVTGSDDEINDPAKSNLEKNGLLPEKIGWYAERISSDLDGVILGMHAKIDNPELIRAQQLGLPIYSFPEYIYEFSKNKKRVVIAGSHGKTTTTSMIMHVLKDSGLAFDYMVGAKVEGFDQSVYLSDAPLIILEGDEYPASVIEKKPKIHFYHPHISVLTGIAWDHINVFPTFENYSNQFKIYLSSFDTNAQLIYNDEDENVSNLVNQFYGRFPLTPYRTPDFIISDHKVVIQTPYGEQELQIFGNHNIQNMEAARYVCNELGVDDMQFYKSIATFKGAARRFEKINERHNFVAYRDFAHAPSKLKATLNGARNQFADKHLIACFELHTYSSLNQAFLNEYRDAMKNCDAGAVFYSKHALELKGLPDLSINDIKKGFGDVNLNVITNKSELSDWIKDEISKSEKPVVLLLMSSGTFDGMNIKF